MRRLAAVAFVLAVLGTGTSLAGTTAPRWQITDLGTLGPAYTSCSAAAINERGQIAGGCGTASGRQHAFLWQNGKMADLGTLGGHDSGAS